MAVKVNFNDRAIKSLLDSGIKEVASDYTKEFKRLSQRYKGRPMNAIKRAIRSFVSKNGGELSSKELENYAQLVHDGVEIKFRFK